VLDTLTARRPDGHVCMAGFLGGGSDIPNFNPLMHLSSGVHLSFFGSASRLVQCGVPLNTVRDLLALSQSSDSRARPLRHTPERPLSRAEELPTPNRSRTGQHCLQVLPQ
jgi:NADPH2:quinone reductase